MRIFGVSDLHIDYVENRRWFENLSVYDYTQDLLILAGDVTDSLELLGRLFRQLRLSFREVAFVPGNHELWVHRDNGINSFEKLQQVLRLAALNGIRTEQFRVLSLSVIPLYGWYDYTFGQPTPETMSTWADYRACKWPGDLDEKGITNYFIEMNRPTVRAAGRGPAISFSHFVPRIDVMPSFIPPDQRRVYPVLGSRLLKEQIRQLGAAIHFYGHSHVNRDVLIDGTRYINNAFGYPHETRITAKALKCIYEL